MTIKIGTIQEMTGEGYELLVDSETRGFVLAWFYNGHLIQAAGYGSTANSCGSEREETLAVVA